MLVGLLFATAAAFAVTEHLKLEKAPIGGTLVSKYLSPRCGCASSKAAIRFRLRHHDVVTVQILDANRHVVATLVQNQPEPKGRVQFAWRGLTDAGAVVPDGRYEPEIHLANAHWTILLPNPINLDTRPPLVRAVSLRPSILSPDGDGVDDQVKIRYRLSEQAHLLVRHGSRVLLRTQDSRPDDKTAWNGTSHGRPWPAGTYTLTVGAVDLAGNVTPPAQRKRLVVVVRYVWLGRTQIAVRAGATFEARVHADAPYTWALGGRHGRSRRPVLRLRAPSKGGSYHLLVRESGHTARALVVVR